MASKQQDETTSATSDELVLKISKEIVIKFIEVGRVTPASFSESFTTIYDTIKNTTQK